MFSDNSQRSERLAQSFDLPPYFHTIFINPKD